MCQSEIQLAKNWDVKQYIITTKNANSGEDVYWNPPSMGWIKFNTDGTIKHNLGEAEGGVIRNEKGEIIAAYFEYFGIPSNHIVELRAMWVGLKLVKRLNLNKIIIEGDSLNIINMFSGAFLPSQNLQSTINDAKNLLREILIHEIKHIYKEGNKVIDILANLAISSK